MANFLNKDKDSDESKSDEKTERVSGESTVSGASAPEELEAGDPEKGEVTDSEEAAAKEMGRGELFAKHQSSDENHPVTSGEQIESLKEGSLQSSGSTSAVDAAIAGSVDAGEDSDLTIYSSHPIGRYRVGRFEFLNSTLKLNSEDSAEFEELLGKLPPRERAHVTKIDVAAAEKVARNFAGNRTRGVDTAGSGPR